MFAKLTYIYIYDGTLLEKEEGDFKIKMRDGIDSTLLAVVEMADSFYSNSSKKTKKQK